MLAWMSGLIDRIVLTAKNHLKGWLTFDRLLLISIVFFASLVLFNWYVAGDLCYYRSAYASVREGQLLEAFSSYRKKIFSADILHFGLIWMFSGLVLHDYLMAIFNAMLALSAYSLLTRHGIGKLLSAAFILFNYYFWVAAIPAERLKFGLIFASFFYLVEFAALKWLFLFLAILSHASAAILFIPYLCAKFFDSNILFTEQKKLGHYAIAIIFGFLAYIYTLGEGVISKILWIANGVDVGIGAIFPTIILGLIAVAFSRWSVVATASVFVIISAMVLIVSSDRLNMFSLLIAIGYIVSADAGRFHFKLLNHGIRDTILFAIFTLMFAKSLVFVINIYNNGAGFGLLENSC